MRRRLSEVAVDTVAQYRWLKLRQSVLGRVLPALNALRRKKIAHILPLGINCEVAVWFNAVFGFVESSLFAWASSRYIERMTRVLSDMDGILGGEVAFNAHSFMWKCERTGLFFHGRFHPAPGAPVPDEAALAADLADLRGRIAHLKEKFRRYVSDGQSTLFIHRISDYDVQTPGLDERLKALEAAIAGLGARNWKLLVVCAKADRKRIPPGPNRLIRTVWRLNPTSCVPDRRKGDAVGWRAIYSEFVPEKVLPKAHTFKFEQEQEDA